MQTSDSRHFKATRWTIRAEITLIIVIVISFSWSAYALYKLILGTSEPLFDFANSSPVKSAANQNQQQQQQQSAPVTSNQASNLSSNSYQLTPDFEQTQASTSQANQPNLTQQLAIYKSEILKELLNRQQNLLKLSNDENTNLLNGNFVTNSKIVALNNHQAANRDVGLPVSNLQPNQININELKSWRGGYKLPSSLNNLLNKNSQTNDEFSGLQTDRIPLGSNEFVQTAIVHPEMKEGNHLVRLRNAPSLMQLQQNNSKFRQLSLDRPDYRNVGSNDEERDDDNHLARSYEQQQDTNARQFEAVKENNDGPSQVDELTTIEPLATNNIDDSTTTTVKPPNDSATSQEPQAAEEVDSDESSDDYDADQSRHDKQAKRHSDDKDSEGEDKDGDGDDDSAAQDSDDKRSMERVKKTVHAIDEEVDRMTQPSLGMASQQDKSFDYKNTVHFDDNFAPQTIDLLPIQRDHLSNRSNKTNRRSGDDESDLQVADNEFERPNVAQNRRRQPSRVDVTTKPKQIHQSRGYRNSSSIVRKRSKRSLETDLINETYAPSSSPERPIKRHKTTTATTSQRRSDDDGNDEDTSNNNDDDEDEDEQQEQAIDANLRDDNPNDRSNQLARQKSGPELQYITTNDPSLQELLAHKQLLDALQQSRLPAPISTSINRNETLAIKKGAENSPTALADSQSDSQAAGTQFTVDHGLLLYPASGEEHHQKSMSKKSKKSSEKKGKKKMTVAMKKGGHKKKKHKKEEKKYLKEKKFKGAKKGKKVAKGKGGKGGKKGKKYYKDKGFKKKGFKNIYVKNEFGQKKSYFDEFRDKDFKKKWKNFDDKYKYAQMKKWQAKDVKGAKKLKDHSEKFKKYDKGKWKKKYQKHHESESAQKKKKKKYDDF